MAHRLIKIYETMFEFFGPQHWWPGDTPFEIMVGAVLTQNTNWRNVERAIDNLKAADALSPEKILSLDNPELAELIRPSGYFNIKAVRLKSLVEWFARREKAHPGFLQNSPLEPLRHDLLAVKGVGPETADSILLYAGGRKTFVIDAYTARAFSRLGVFNEGVTYDEMQSRFMRDLPEEVPLYNEYHALIVALGKDYCRPKPKCEDCPLKKMCSFRP